MASNRTEIFKKVNKVVKKHFKPTLPNLRMPLLEQLVYAACLENSNSDPADQAYAALEEQFFDWNEIRVSTVTELSEVIHMLPDAKAASSRVKKSLQSAFEANYSFDLEAFKKENIGVAVKRLKGYQGVTPFAVAYVTQNALGGHAIPLGAGALEIFFIIGAISEKEKAAHSVPGIERAIPKNKGPEFGSLINQLGVEFQRTPFGPAVRKIILEIEPSAKDRLPKRRSKTAKPKRPEKKAKAALKKPQKGAKAKTVTKKVTVKKKKTAAAKKPVKAKTKKKTTVKRVKKKVATTRGAKRKPK
jgi:endonuclease-3